METQKNDEKNIVLELKRQLGRMMVQVDYMYRNDREPSRLDIDIMMEHTRDLYDLLCDYQSDKIEIEPETTKIVEKEINEGGEFVNHEPEEEPVEDDDLDEEDWEDEDDEMFHVENIEPHTTSIHPCDLL